MTNSYFDGGVLKYTLLQIFIGVVSFLSLGLLTPWALVVFESWKAEHTVINGQRMAFVGTGTQLFGKWILWLLLTVLTLGIYSLWLPVNTMRWVTENTRFQN